ncbi:toxin-antitoxin system YwqK family antitoxin [Wenyingzhuangia aestuarii]|uniref:hypothetical protein n=1 Tax=Wenyingzhuangia aestuarii TaxID=1647582 RepID=UPI00143999DC|nr:hypothetical protein [Wenyingzhuangia aestuarii]NJB83158.1 antitoxin component YwqK of YwqJK toxin-antitoxin module [Wenyingzhuangia aestuarii]
MRFFFLLAMFFIASTTASIAQELKTKKIKEKVSTVKHTKKIFYVLEDNNEIRHGAYEEFVDGEIVVSGNYKLGEKDGNWIYKDPKGKYLQKGSFDKGKQIGKWEFKNLGVFYKQTFYSDKGIIDSAFSYNANKKLIYRYIFDPEKNEEVSESFLNSGFKKTITTKDSIVKVSIYYPNNQLFFEKKTVGKKLMSVSNYYKKNGGIFRESNFVEGTGVVLNFYMDKLQATGELLGSKAISYKNGEPYGMYLRYDKKGSLLEKGVLVSDSRVGKWLIWSSKKKEYVEKDYGHFNAKRVKKEYKKSLKTPSYVAFVDIQTPPLLMRVDDYSKHIKNAKKEFTEIINNHMRNVMNISGFAEYCNSKNGVCRILTLFTVDVFGEISDIKVRATHPEIEAEVRRSLKKLPTFIPAYQQGRNVNLLFELPLVFSVKQTDPFAEMNKLSNTRF